MKITDVGFEKQKKEYDKKRFEKIAVAALTGILANINNNLGLRPGDAVYEKAAEHAVQAAYMLISKLDESNN